MLVTEKLAKLAFCCSAVCNYNKLGVREELRMKWWLHNMGKNASLCNLLDFAGDIAHINDPWSSVQQTISDLQEEASKIYCS